MTKRLKWCGYFFEGAVLCTFAALLAAFWTLVHFPAVMSVDSFMVLQEALEGKFTGQHPPILGLITKAFIYFFGLKVYILAFAQAFFLYLSGLFLLRSLSHSSRVPYVVGGLFLACYPPAWVYSVTLWKDVFFTIQLAFLGAFLLRFFRNPTTFNIVSVFVFLSMSLLARHNAILILPLLFSVILFLFWRMQRFQGFSWKKRAFILCFVSSSVFAPALLGRILNSRSSNFRETVFIGMYAGWNTQQARLNKDPDPLALKFWNVVFDSDTGYKRLVERESVLGEEWTYMMDPKFRPYFPRKALEVVSIESQMLTFLTRNPLTVASYIFGYLKRLTDWRNDQPYWYHANIWPDNSLGIQAQSRLPKVHDWLFYKALPKFYKKFFRKHWVFLLISMLAFLTGIILFLRPRFSGSILALPAESFLLLPSLCLGYFSSFIVVTTVADWRYLFPVNYLMFCFSIVLLISFLKFFWENLIYRRHRGVI